MKTFHRTMIIVASIFIVVGIALVIAGGVSGAFDGLHGKYDFSWDGKDVDTSKLGTSDSTGNYDNVQSLNVDMTYGTLVIEEGDSFKYETFNINKNKFSSSVENGKWSVVYGEKWNFGFLYFHDDTPTIKLTIPKGTVLKEADCNVKAGEFRVDTLQADDLTLEIAGGSFRAKNITANNNLTMTVGAGEISIDSFSSKDVKMDCGAGQITANGTILGNGDLNCGMGNITMKLGGAEKDYNYDVQCGLGNVTLGDNNTSSFSTDKTIDNDASKKLKIECGMGNVVLKFVDNHTF